MNNPISANPPLGPNERIVSATSNGGTWCAWDGMPPECPIACPDSLDIAGDGKSASKGFDTRYDDNHGVCGYTIYICGS